MGFLTTISKVLGIGLVIWAIGRGIRTAHPLNRAASALRWSVVGLALLVAAVGFESKTLPDVVFLAADFALVLFLFLPDLSYYLVLGVRTASGMIRRRKYF